MYIICTIFCINICSRYLLPCVAGVGTGCTAVLGAADAEAGTEAGAGAVARTAGADVDADVEARAEAALRPVLKLALKVLVPKFRSSFV